MRYIGYVLIRGKGKKEFMTNHVSNAGARENFIKMSGAKRKDIMKVSCKEATWNGRRYQK